MGLIEAAPTSTDKTALQVGTTYAVRERGKEVSPLGGFDDKAGTFDANAHLITFMERTFDGKRQIRANLELLAGPRAVTTSPKFFKPGLSPSGGQKISIDAPEAYFKIQSEALYLLAGRWYLPVIESVQLYTNPHISNSHTFNVTPYTWFGIAPGLEGKVLGKKVNAYAGVINEGDTGLNEQHSPGGMAAFNLKFSRTSLWNLFAVVDHEKVADDPKNRRYAIDTFITASLRDLHRNLPKRVQGALNFQYGVLEREGQWDSWWGIVGYLNMKVKQDSPLKFSLRGERFRSGFRLEGRPTDLVSGTVGLDYLIHDDDPDNDLCKIRLEGRYDKDLGGNNPFNGEDFLLTGALGVVCSFEKESDD